MEWNEGVQKLEEYDSLFDTHLMSLSHKLEAVVPDIPSEPFDKRSQLTTWVSSESLEVKRLRDD